MAAIALTVLLFAGCKPTEKNYRAAYDLAQGKREREAQERKRLESDMQLVGEAGELQDVYGIRLEPLGGDTVRVLHHNFADPALPEPYLLLVAKMKMPANAKAMADRLPGGAVAEYEDDFYVIGARADSPELIIMRAADFRKSNPGWRAINLPDVTVCVQR